MGPLHHAKEKMKKILVVDDNPDIRRLLAITLGNTYEVLLAEDGKSALQAMRDHAPHAVLLDSMMPGELDGLQVLQAIRSDPQLKDTVVAMVTARGQSVDQLVGMALGANAYFVKPFSPLKIMTWVQESLK